MKHTLAILKRAWPIALIFCMIVLVGSLAFATQYTKTASAGRHNGVSYSYVSHTFVAATDTVIWVLSTPFSANPHETVGQLMIGTSSLNGDSVNIAVRYEVSVDGSQWQSFTVGTDSTTWFTALQSTNYKYVTTAITQASYGGFMPYVRVRVMGQAGNNIGTKLKVYFIPQ